MYNEFFYSNERKGLWTKEMLLLSLSNFFLYISLYIYLPTLPFWLSDKYDCSLIQGTLVLATFAVAIFIPGPFNNYLLDAFKRKNVAFWSSAFLSLAAIGYLGATSLIIVLALRIIQGLLFSIITTTTSSTLVIDVTPTTKRTLANLFFTRIGRFGMIIGVIVGVYLYNIYDMILVFYISAALTLLSGILVLFIRVPFRAPLKPSLLSLDRFLLPRVLPAAFNMIACPIIIGILITIVELNVYFLFLISGFILGFVLVHILFKNLESKRELEMSTLFSIIGFLMFTFTSSIFISLAGFILLGIGLSISANRFYVMIISLPHHCERGSANNTYNLIWELGISTGVVIGFYFDGLDTTKFFISISIMLISLLVYEFKIHKWYYRLMDDK